MENSKLWTSEVFFERLDFFLKAHNLTMYQLCSGVDLTADSLYKMRSRHSLPSLRSVCIICDALGISLSEFFETEITDPNSAAIMSSLDTMSNDSLSALTILVKCLK